MAGINAAQANNIIMGDSDDSYDFLNIDLFYQKLEQGYDLVMGNRFRGGVENNAMPFLHKYLGNPVLTKMGKIFFNSPCNDFHCGLRGIKKSAVEAMDLCTKGMEFASEMVVKASLYKMKITEVPTTLACDGRNNHSTNLRTWRDGWRHLRFMLLYSPNWLFLYPGIFLVVLGCLVGTILLPGPVTLFKITFDIHTLLFASMFVVLGFQSIAFSLIGKAFCLFEGLMPAVSRLDELLKAVRLETGLVAGLILTILGAIGAFCTVGYWGLETFGNLDTQFTMRIAIPSLTMIAVGVQISMTAFLLGIIGMKRR